MRNELTDYEWAAIKPLLPNKPRGAIAASRSASALISTVPGIWLSGSSTRSKQCRDVATRYDKLAANYLAFIQLASIRLWLRVNESTP
jgi:transposase